MPTYQFEAMDATGQEIKDVIDAPSEEEAQATIRQMGYFVTKIAVKKGGGGQDDRPAAKRNAASPSAAPAPSSISLFTRQLSILQDAGLPILRSLRILEGAAEARPPEERPDGRRRRDRRRLHAQRSDGQKPQGLQPPVRQHDQGRRGRRCAGSHSCAACPSSWNGQRIAQTQGQRRDDLSGRRHHGRRRHLDVHHAQDRARVPKDVRGVRPQAARHDHAAHQHLQVGRQSRLVHDAAGSGRACGCSSSCSASSSTAAWAGTCSSLKWPIFGMLDRKEHDGPHHADAGHAGRLRRADSRRA